MQVSQLQREHDPALCNDHWSAVARATELTGDGHLIRRGEDMQGTKLSACRPPRQRGRPPADRCMRRSSHLNLASGEFPVPCLRTVSYDLSSSSLR